jgi:hypothetical protein
MQAEQLIETLLIQNANILKQAEDLKHFSIEQLSWKLNSNAWNILECLEHLNRYGDFYLPKMESKIKTTVHKSDVVFKSGILGGYFAKSMLPKDKLNKMKTFKDKNPMNDVLDTAVIDKFIAQQHLLIELLNRSKQVSLNKVKIPTSISALIQINLGDTFQFYTNHMIRHMHQIDRIVLGYTTCEKF